MQATTHGDATNYAPKYALVVYAGEGGKGGFLTAHKVDVTSKGPVIGPGVLADKTALKKLVREINPKAKRKPELLHPRTLAKGDGYHLWWLPPAKRAVWFNAETIGKRSGVTPHPGLVFCIAGGRWSVFAVKGDERPGADTMLYVAPYLNVWISGEICDGTADIPRGKAAASPEAWESPFFESEFTHTNYHGAKCTTYKGGIYALWKALLDRRHRKFPEASLVSHGLTLQGLMDRADN